MIEGPMFPRSRPTGSNAPWLAFLLLLPLACSDEQGDETPRAQRGEPVVKTVKDGDVVYVGRVFGKTLAFGERLEAELEVRAPDASTVRDLTLGAYAGHLLVREREVVLDEHEGGTHTQRVRCQLEARSSGTQLALFPPLAYHGPHAADGAPNWKTLQLPAFEIEVSVPTAEGRPTLDDLNGPGNPLPMPIERSVPRFVPYALGALLLLAGLVVFFIMRARRLSTYVLPPRDPRDLAREALDALLAQGYVERGEFAAFYYELTLIVREYIERTTGVRAPELTTEEFLRACERRTDVALFRGEGRARLRRFLESADLIKYAAQVPDATAVDESLAAARVFCELAAPSAQEVFA